MSSKVQRIKKILIYQTMSPDGEQIEQNFLSACKVYGASDMNLCVLARTYSIVQNSFLRSFKRLYFYKGSCKENCLSDEVYDNILNKLMNTEKLIKQVEIDRIDELREEYKKLLEKKKVYYHILKSNPESESFKSKIRDLNLRINQIKCDDVFVKL